ncbi:carboxypeptidase regulatory-like domain-containing protein [Edaphobacter sp. 4G125]|nr:carboxypeptidase regulatory-like domain-containing protein [Edaphobacter sp. 4G125]
MKDFLSLRSRLGKAALVMSSLGVVAAVPVISGSQAIAQQRGPVQRVVEGKVTDHDNAPIKGAVVYLKDGRTLSVKSFIADDQGEYRFGQLTQNTDYEIWAESNGKKSAVKSISSFDSKNHFYIDLKLGK